MDSTPIFDIKPYVPYADAFPDAQSGFTGLDKIKTLQVDIPQEIEQQLGSALTTTLKEVLALDPRPQYHHDVERVYGMAFESYDIHFKVDDEKVQVISASSSTSNR